MSNLFPRARDVALQNVREFLPNGRIEGDEYTCLNPNRSDKSAGSFKINIKTGKWADFADDAAGNDCISLYAYLNRSSLEQKVLSYENQPKNFEGAVQAAAAREILEEYDLSYYPTDEDKFIPAKKTTSYWQGWHQCTIGTDNEPDLDQAVKWVEEKTEHGKCTKRWSGFVDKKGRTIFYVCRHINSEGKKADLPYSLFANGKEFRWRFKGMKEITEKGFLIPPYRQDILAKRENDPILIVEGQKCAQAGIDYIGDKYIVTCVYGGKIESMDLDLFTGRSVWYWFDPDRAGRKKMQKMKVALESIECNFTAVHSPVGTEPGYDIADAIEDGWTKEEIIQHIEKKAEVFLDDGLSFKIVGVTPTDIFFFPRESKCIMSYKKHSLSKNALMTLMPRDTWGEYFSKPDGGIAWDKAADYVLRKSAGADFFQNTMVRGSGAWRDEGRLVIHTGRYLIVDGKEVDLYNIESKYVYEKRDYVPYKTKGCKAIESKRLLHTLKHINFRDDKAYLLLAGWLLLAPFGGAIDWRSKIWITGPRGSGKTWILENIIFPIVGNEFGYIAPGTSSEAAIRRQAGTSSLPNIHDEMESDNKQYAENINSILMFYRVGASGDSGGIIKVGSDGNIQIWKSQCMACFASIGASITHGADSSRINVITLKNNSGKKEKENFNVLQENKSIFTSEWVKSLHGRTLSIFSEVEKAVQIFRKVSGDMLGSSRDGDQVGTLLAGAYMLEHDQAPIASACKTWLEEHDVYRFQNDDETDEKLCLNEILHHQIEVSDSHNRQKQTVAFFLAFYFQEVTGSKITTEIVKEACEVNKGSILSTLQELGILPEVDGDDAFVRIAVGKHPGIRAMYNGTAWKENYQEILERVPSFIKRSKGPGRFGSLRKRYLVFDAREIFDEIPF